MADLPASLSTGRTEHSHDYRYDRGRAHCSARHEYFCSVRAAAASRVVPKREPTLSALCFQDLTWYLKVRACTSGLTLPYVWLCLEIMATESTGAPYPKYQHPVTGMHSRAGGLHAWYRYRYILHNMFTGSGSHAGSHLPLVPPLASPYFLPSWVP